MGTVTHNPADTADNTITKSEYESATHHVISGSFQADSLLELSASTVLTVGSITSGQIIVRYSGYVEGMDATIDKAAAITWAGGALSATFTGTTESDETYAVGGKNLDLAKAITLAAKTNSDTVSITLEAYGRARSGSIPAYLGTIASTSFINRGQSTGMTGSLALAGPLVSCFIRVTTSASQLITGDINAQF